MKSAWIILLLSIIFIVICGCTSIIGGGGSLTPGVYENSKNPSSFVTVDADRNFIQELPMDISWGIYKMNGDVITVEGNCREGKGLMYPRFCGENFTMIYKLTNKDTFCQMNGQITSVCYTLNSS